MTHPLLDKHRATLDGALEAIRTRGYWSAYNEMPSPKTYGETAAEVGKQAWVGVPRRERATAHHHAHPLTDDFKVLLHYQGGVFALRLVPNGFGRHKALFAVGVGDGFKAALLGVR